MCRGLQQWRRPTTFGLLRHPDIVNAKKSTQLCYTK